MAENSDIFIKKLKEANQDNTDVTKILDDLVEILKTLKVFNENKTVEQRTSSIF